MIPYAILAGEIRYKDGQAIQIQAEELSTAGFTFRLPAGRQLYIEEIAAIDLTWFCMQAYEYQRIGLSDWSTDDTESGNLRGECFGRYDI